MSHPSDPNYQSPTIHYEVPQAQMAPQPMHMAPPQPVYYGQPPAPGYQPLPGGQHPGGMPQPTVIHMQGGGCPVCK